MQPPQTVLLPDGRLHLHHGPIDLVIDAHGPGRTQGLRRATARFQTILGGLAAILPDLRRPVTPATRPFPDNPIANRMLAATRPFADHILTPMAAVAGAVADEVLRTIATTPGLSKAWVNNGGDIALHLTPGERFRAALEGAPGTHITLDAQDQVRGIATSGWRGRSHSLGIADSVTVLATTAAAADAAATLIGNEVDLPGHPAISRVAARTLAPDSDLGGRLVTTGVGPLTTAETRNALERGQAFAQNCYSQGLIQAAYLTLGHQHHQIGRLNVLETIHA